MIRKLQPEIKEELPNETQNTKYSTATTHSAQLNHGRVMTSLLKMATIIMGCCHRICTLRNCGIIYQTNLANSL